MRTGMQTGKVKWFNNAKGFGFILPDDGGDDLFAHYSQIGMEGYRTLKAGQVVTYELQQGPKGLHASNIMPDLSEEILTTRDQRLAVENGQPASTTQATAPQLTTDLEEA